MKPGLSGDFSGHSATKLGPWRRMRRYVATLLLGCTTVLLQSGCRTPASQTLLERENFQQEKCIEDLRDQVDEAKQDLEQCRRENAALKRQSRGEPSATPTDIASPRSSPASSIPTFEPPTVDRGTEAPPKSPPALPQSTSPPAAPPALPNSSQQDQWMPPTDAPVIDEPDHAAPDSGATTSSYQQEESPRAERIAIIRLLTNGHQFGGHSPISYASSIAVGDNGLQAAFSPRDAENRAVASEGSVAMVVIDPAISGSESRVARWDFTAAEAKAHYRQTLFGRAYRFDLLWPHDPPQHERLKLFVRLTTPDGRRLEANQTISVKLGRQTPAADDANLAESDSPVQRDGPVRSELVSTRSSATNAADMGQYDADDPAPTDSPIAPIARPTIVHHGAVWRPDR